MIVAHLFRGPYDGELLTLPEPIGTHVIVEFHPIQVEWFYLRAGQLDEDAFAYLYGSD